MEKRLVDIETRLSFQEDSIESLSKLIAEQQNQLDLLTRRVESIVGLLEQILSGNEP